MPSIGARRLAVASALLVLAPSLAGAHFVLRAPASWRAQDGFGSPQKLGPCGDEGTGGETGAVTAYAPGDTVTIVLDETIFHPGHYRVALAVDDRRELPAEPAVTPGTTDCGSVPVMDPPVLPVLADGVLEHTEPFAGTQSIEVTLPATVTCAHCTLQVLEFMSDHPAPCFYHHCADLSIGVPTATGCSADADCDDGDACTRDACTPSHACVASPIALADVASGFLGTLALPACAGVHVPAAVAARFHAADDLVTRARAVPAKETRFLRRAVRKLHAVARTIATRGGRRIPPACGAALGDVLARAGVRVGCLAGASD